jgi:hypothetical protein
MPVDDKHEIDRTGKNPRLLDGFDRVITDQVSATFYVASDLQTLSGKESLSLCPILGVGELTKSMLIRRSHPQPVSFMTF